MLIAVISDTHRSRFSISEAAKLIADTDMVIHLGDNVEDIEDLKEVYRGNILNVRGNCDFDSFTPVERLEIIEGKRIFMTHGHKYNVKYGLNSLKYRAMEVEADIVLFGHTHEALAVQEEGIWFVNPGSAAMPRDRYKSVAVIEISDNNIVVTMRKIK